MSILSNGQVLQDLDKCSNLAIISVDLRLCKRNRQCDGMVQADFFDDMVTVLPEHPDVYLDQPKKEWCKSLKATCG